MKNVFEKETVNELTSRIEKLNPAQTPNWGKMNAPQMLAHCSVPYSMIMDDNIPKAKGIKKLLMKWVVKPVVTGPKPYKKNNRTAPEFIINDERDFEKEKSILINHIKKTQSLGLDFFIARENPNFGKLTKLEWNTLFYKHLDHHLNQFGV